MSQLLNTLIIPDNTKMEEHFVVVDGDVIIGNYVDLGYGIRANSIVAGERVKIGGGIIADSDIRIDHRPHISGDVIANADVYIGEFAHIDGKLTVEGDMDIGKEAKIKDGYIAKGWITIRSPVPVIVLLYIYLLELFKMGKGKEVENALESMFNDTMPTLGDRIMLIPNNTKITLESLDAGSSNINIGNDCLILGTLRGNTVEIGDDGQIFGSVRANADVFVGCNTLLHGSIYTDGIVHINNGCRILGNIVCATLYMHPTVKIEGKTDVGDVYTNEDIARPRHFDGGDIVSEVTNLVASNAKERSLWASRRRGLRHVRGMRRYRKKHDPHTLSGSWDADTHENDDSQEDVHDVDIQTEDTGVLEDSVNEIIQDVVIKKSNIDIIKKNSLLEKFGLLDDEWSEAETKRSLHKSAKNPDDKLDPDDDDNDSDNESNGMDKIS